MTKEEAIERIKNRFDKWALDEEDKNAIQTLIPELKGSEDERIRKELLSFIESVQHSYLCATDRREKWIAYLEKQKEQKPLPGFDVLTPDEKMNHPLYLEGFDVGREVGWVEAEQKPADDKAFEEWLNDWYNEYHRYGYITMDEREFKNFCRGIRNMYQQKPAEWSEEDEEALDMCLDVIPKRWKTKSGILLTEWLKDKIYTQQPKQEWSEEDERILKGIIGKIDHDQTYGVSKAEMLSFLESLRPQPKQDCSGCAENIRGYINGRNDALREMSDFMNSQETLSATHWKPTEEQMNALERASKNEYLSAKQFDILVSLCEQLKKLGVKEELEYYQHFDPDC